MIVYLDASVLLAMLIDDDALSARVDAFLRDSGPVVVVSDFAAAECASALARRVRMGEIVAEDARAGFATLDTWMARAAQRAETTAADIRVAASFLRRLDLTLRTPDAVNLAIAQRVGAALATFDVKLAACAAVLGTAVVAA